MYKCQICGCYEGLLFKLLGGVNHTMCPDCNNNFEEYVNSFEEFRNLSIKYAETRDAYDIMFQRAAIFGATIEDVNTYREAFSKINEEMWEFMEECFKDCINLNGAKK